MSACRCGSTRFGRRYTVVRSEVRRPGFLGRILGREAVERPVPIGSRYFCDDCGAELTITATGTRYHDEEPEPTPQRAAGPEAEQLRQQRNRSPRVAPLVPKPRPDP